MRLGLILATLVLATAALPAASAGHTVSNCMNNIWQPSNPPGWEYYCTTADWLSHNPYGPLANCLADQLEIYVVGVSYDVEGAIACL